MFVFIEFLAVKVSRLEASRTQSFQLVGVALAYVRFAGGDTISDACRDSLVEFA